MACSTSPAAHGSPPCAPRAPPSIGGTRTSSSKPAYPASKASPTPPSATRPCSHPHRTLLRTGARQDHVAFGVTTTLPPSPGQAHLPAWPSTVVLPRPPARRRTHRPAAVPRLLRPRTPGRLEPLRTQTLGPHHGPTPTPHRSRTRRRPRRPHPPVLREDRRS